ncbi:hypothetical protein ACLOJK_040846 [Asimina triloba]
MCIDGLWIRLQSSPGILQGHAAGRDAAGELLTIGFAGLLLVVDQVGPMELVAYGDVAHSVVVGEEMGNVAGQLDLESMQTIDAVDSGIRVAGHAARRRRAHRRSDGFF